MGDPKKARKRFVTPSHPWQKERIVAEKELMREYGLKNKKELWKMNTVVKQFQARAKRHIASTLDVQSELEEKQLLERLVKFGILSQEADIDDVLGLSARDILERRLQTLVVRNGLARTMKQARQFIVHRHIKVNGKKVTAPGYMVSIEEQPSIEFAPNSVLVDEEHPERAVKQEAPAAPEEPAQEAKDAPEQKTDEKAAQQKAPETKQEEKKE